MFHWKFFTENFENGWINTLMSLNCDYKTHCGSHQIYMAIHHYPSSEQSFVQFSYPCINVL